MASFTMHRRSSCWCFVLFLLCSELIVVGGAFSKLFWQRQQSSPSSLLFSRSTADYNDGKDPVSSRTSKAPTDQAARRETVTENLEASNVPDWKRSLPDPLCSRPFLERIDLRAPSPLALYYSEEDSEDEDPVFAHVYLLGTAHASDLSCQDARMLLEHVDPDVVFLELCDQRMASIWTNWNKAPSRPPTGTSDNDDDISSQAKIDENDPTFWQQVQYIQEQDGHSFVAAAALATLVSWQSEVAAGLGVDLGGEFRAAIQYSLTKAEQLENESYGDRRNIHVVLGDRPENLTWRRAWDGLSWWARTRLSFYVLGNLFFDDEDDEEMEDEINSIKEWDESDLDKIVFTGMRTGIRDEINSILESGELGKSDVSDLRQNFPSFVEAIIDERDAYMACKLHQAAGHFAAVKLVDDDDGYKNLTMVAIVGAGHVRGMMEWFSDGKIRQPAEEVLRELVQTKYSQRTKQKRWWRRLLSRINKDPQVHHAGQRKDTLSERELFLINGLSSIRLP